MGPPPVMNALRLLAIVLTSLLAVACGGSDTVMQPSKSTNPVAIQGLVRERGAGDFVEFATETFEALYDAETVRAPEWSVSAGTLMGNGSSARWQLPRAGTHTISLKLFLVDGREIDASWTVKVVARTADHAS